MEQNSGRSKTSLTEKQVEEQIVIPFGETKRKGTH